MGFDSEWDCESSDNESDYRYGKSKNRRKRRGRQSEKVELRPCISIPPSLVNLVGTDVAIEFSNLLTPQDDDAFVARTVVQTDTSVEKGKRGRKRIEYRVDESDQDDNSLPRHPEVGSTVETPFGLAVVCQPDGGPRSDDIVQVPT